MGFPACSQLRLWSFPNLPEKKLRPFETAACIGALRKTEPGECAVHEVGYTSAGSSSRERGPVFRDERQRNAVCRAILPDGYEEGWTETGPSLASLPSCTPADRAMILLAWALWNGSGGLQVAELVMLDAERLAVVGSLFQALSEGPRAIDVWLAANCRAPAEGAAISDLA
jgi:hypothetical protein